MRILVACEYSGVVRDAFRKKGHDAWSCDLLPCDGDTTYHIQGDVLKVLKPTDTGFGLKDYINFTTQDGTFRTLDENGWDLMIAHPPCTHLAVSGARYFKEKIADGRQQRALDFVQMLMNANIDKICIENPISVISSKIRKPDQIIQPWMFGHGETKATCLWLKNLPKLEPTNVVEGRENRIWKMPPGPNRWKERSRTYQGIADAMAEQWS